MFQRNRWNIRTTLQRCTLKVAYLHMSSFFWPCKELFLSNVLYMRISSLGFNTYANNFISLDIFIQIHFTLIEVGIGSGDLMPENPNVMPDPTRSYSCGLAFKSRKGLKYHWKTAYLEWNIPWQQHRYISGFKRLNVNTQLKYIKHIHVAVKPDFKASCCWLQAVETVSVGSQVMHVCPVCAKLMKWRHHMLRHIRTVHDVSGAKQQPITTLEYPQLCYKDVQVPQTVMPCTVACRL